MSRKKVLRNTGMVPNTKSILINIHQNKYSKQMQKLLSWVKKVNEQHYISIKKNEISHRVKIMFTNTEEHSIDVTTTFGNYYYHLQCISDKISPRLERGNWLRGCVYMPTHY